MEPMDSGGEHAQRPHPEALAEDRGRMLAEVSNRIVGLHKEFYGKGPTKAKTYYQGDLLVVLLRGGFTRVEETLRAAGRGANVIEQRMAFQEVMRDRYKEVIEEATGRRVVGFMSGSQQDPDMLAELFVLEPSDLDEHGPEAREPGADKSGEEPGEPSPP
jgi:uncharacterized protein YbcI